jgi:hypothetical protein
MKKLVLTISILLVGCLLLGSELLSSAESKRGRIVINNDDWTFADEGFVSPNDPWAFATNVASWFMGGVPGNFLVYSDHFGLTGAKLAEAMTSAGHTWVIDSTMPFTLPNISTYDAVFLGVTGADNKVLIDYVNAGGNVYVFSGGDTESAKWNAFLGYFGLRFKRVNNGIVGDIPITSTHPLFAGVDHLYQDIGTSIIDLDPLDPRNKVLMTYSNQGLYAVYDSDFDPDIHGCLQLSGKPIRNRKVVLRQSGQINQTTYTDANGCYDFDNAVSGKPFDVLIKGPVVP